MGTSNVTSSNRQHETNVVNVQRLNRYELWELNAFLINGYARLYRGHICEIPNEIGLLIQSYVDSICYQLLTFSEQYMTHGDAWKLSKDRKFIKRTSSGICAYVLADSQPVTKGVHCWRVQITSRDGSNHSTMFGVSQKKRFNDFSYTGAGFHGVSCCDPNHINGWHRYDQFHSAKKYGRIIGYC
eukprot:204291_1